MCKEARIRCHSKKAFTPDAKGSKEKNSFSAAAGANFLGYAVSTELVLSPERGKELLWHWFS